jgi:hypothetical protein
MILQKIITRLTTFTFILSCNIATLYAAEMLSPHQSYNTLVDTICVIGPEIIPKFETAKQTNKAALRDACHSGYELFGQKRLLAKNMLHLSVRTLLVLYITIAKDAGLHEFHTQCTQYLNTLEELYAKICH